MIERCLEVNGVDYRGEESFDQRVTLTPQGEEGSIQICAESDWWGDTETGFGADVSVSISREGAQKIRDYLSEWLAKPQATEA